jgi:hypothetical protein
VKADHLRIQIRKLRRNRVLEAVINSDVTSSKLADPA